MVVVVVLVVMAYGGMVATQVVVVEVAIEFQGVPRVFRIGHKENMVIEYVYFDPGQAECKKNYCIPQTLYPSKFDGVAI